MRLGLPRLRVSVRTMTVLIAVLAVSFWAALNIWSPTRRLGRLLRADQPAYVRREAASSLGHEIPSWEVDRAVSLLIGALDDPSPRVREYAGVGLIQLGRRAERALPKLVAAFDDDDRYVRFMAVRTAGALIEAGAARPSGVVLALSRALDDPDFNVRLAAAQSLVEVGEAPKAVSLLVAECSSSDSTRRYLARLILRSAHQPRHFVAALVKELHNPDAKRRDEAFQTLLSVVSPSSIRSVLESLKKAEDPRLRQWAEERFESLSTRR